MNHQQNLDFNMQKDSREMKAEEPRLNGNFQHPQQYHQQQAPDSMKQYPIDNIPQQQNSMLPNYPIGQGTHNLIEPQKNPLEAMNDIHRNPQNLLNSQSAFPNNQYIPQMQAPLYSQQLPHQLYPLYVPYPTQTPYYLLQYPPVGPSYPTYSAGSLYPQQPYMPLLQQTQPTQTQAPIKPQMPTITKNKKRWEMEEESEKTQDDDIFRLNNAEQLKTAYFTLKSKFIEIKEEIENDRSIYEAKIRDKEIENSCLRATINTLEKSTQADQNKAKALQDSINLLEQERQNIENENLSINQKILAMKNLLVRECPSLAKSVEDVTLAENELAKRYTVITIEEAKMLEGLVNEINSKFQKVINPADSN